VSEIVGSVLALLLSFGLFVAVRRLLRRRCSLSKRLLGVLVGLGAASAYGCWLVEAWFWELSGLSLIARPETTLAALLAMLLFAAPLEEGIELFLVWGLHQLGWLHKPADGLVAAVAVAAGFAASESLLQLRQAASLPLVEARIALGVCAQLFFAGAWGMVLGTRSKLHLLSFSWFAAMSVHGLFDHIVFGRGEGTLVFALPMLAMMLGLSWLAIKELRQGEQFVVQQHSGLVPPSLREIRRAMRRRERPLMLRWIVLGAFVTTGVALAFLVGAVVLGHQIGVDFSVADEGDVRSNGPLVLLGSAVLAAFPVAGFLVARASMSQSVLEPAMGAALAIAAVVALLSLAAPVAVVFALAVAPVAFGIACVGAWF
jgi:RsiW-degrading membrane proteinase PrsW (M82 family)